MSRWHLDVVRHTCKALIPFQDQLRRVKRRVLLYRTDEGMDRGLLDDGLRMIDALRDAGADLEHSTVLEIGSGWHPVIPLLFRIAGVPRVLMADQSRLMDLSLIRSAGRFLDRHRDALLARGLHPPTPGGEADDHASFDTALERLGLRYLAPFDFAAVPDRSVDVIVSRAVLEHIPPNGLESLAAQCRRVLAANGYICHVVDNTDHYAHADRTIDYLNFLKFDDWQWRLLTLGPLCYTNRLRHSDYRNLFERAGLRIEKEQRNIDARSLAALRSRRLAAPFRDRDPEDLATATSLFIARVAGDGPFAR